MAEKYGSGCILPLETNKDDTNWDLVVPDVMPDCDLEIGFFLNRSARGKGIATEACKRLIRSAFEVSQLGEWGAICDERNLRSRNVLQKVGLAHRGRVRAYGKKRPAFHIRREEWANQPMGQVAKPNRNALPGAVSPVEDGGL